MRRSSGTAIIVIVLLLLPFLYIGAYLALVVPGGVSIVAYITLEINAAPVPVDIRSDVHYRFAADRAAWFFWPLEQLDRAVRPGAWSSPQNSPILLEVG
jgi:hypothetical protein